jgi:hypothetical protein
MLWAFLWSRQPFAIGQGIIVVFYLICSGIGRWGGRWLGCALTPKEGPYTGAFWFPKKSKPKKKGINMAGKKRQPGKKQENRGGKRSNQTGRPPKVAISQYQLDQMIAKAEKWSKKHKGMTVDDYLLKWIYGEVEDDFKLTMRDRIACVKIWKDYTMAKVQEKNISVGKTNYGPTIIDRDSEGRTYVVSGNPEGPIFLPRMRPDPAKEILSKRKTKKNKVIKLGDKK